MKTRRKAYDLNHTGRELLGQKIGRVSRPQAHPHYHPYQSKEKGLDLEGVIEGEGGTRLRPLAEVVCHKNQCSASAVCEA